MHGLALTILAGGILLLLLSIPLIQRRIPMNPFYGVRVRAAFESSERWYQINERGGRLLRAAACVIIPVGVAGLFLPPERLDAYAWTSLAVSITALGAALFRLGLWVRTLPPSRSGQGEAGNAERP